MDRQIDEALAGRIGATPFSSTPYPQVTPQGDATPPPIEISALTAMLLTLADLPPGAIIKGKGPPETTDALQSYVRSFGPVGAAIRLGSSEATEVRVTVGIYDSPQHCASSHRDQPIRGPRIVSSDAPG